MRSIIAKILAVGVLMALCSYSGWPQSDDRWLIVDEFGRTTNDELMSRVDRFHEALDKRDDTVALVILYGPRTAQYLNQRRIEGCSRWRKHPSGRFRFVFGPEEHPTQIQVKFYLVAKDSNIKVDPPDYKLPNLKKGIELNGAFETDEYCPRYFDVERYSHFMIANPTFRGRVLIDSSSKEFVRRVTKYREELEKLGVAPSTVKFLRRHFIHERDEQWWLIPAKRK